MSFTTRYTLIDKLLGEEELVWDEFYALYSPVIASHGHYRGLTSTEREELVQEVMMSFFKGSREFQFDPSKGRFRAYLRTITDRKAIDIYHRRKKLDVSIDQTPGFDIESDESADAHWDKVWKEQMMQMALEKLEACSSESSYRAFYQVVMEKRKAQEVADELNMSVNSVYFAKHRLMVKVREILEQLEKL